MTAAVVAAAPVPELRERREAAPRAARHGWATHSVVMVASDTGELVPEVPGALYAGIPGWRSQQTWREAFKIHPRVGEATRRYETCPDRLHQVIELAATYADPSTGRGIRVAHGTLARQLGVTSKVIQRCFWAAEDLGLLERVLDGSDMTMAMRGQLRDHYGHRDGAMLRPNGRRMRRGTQSKLPNVYAATIPRWLATQLPGIRPKPVRGTEFAGVAVDNFRRSIAAKLANVHPPVGDTTNPPSRYTSYASRTTFEPSCAQPAGLEPTADRTAATRPTKAHQGKSTGRHRRRLDPAVERFARALRRDLPGFRDVSLHRICPALSCYVAAGLSVSGLRHGIDDYLAAANRTWLTSWRPDQAQEQARYLVGTLTRARIAGYIRLPDPDDPYEDIW